MLENVKNALLSIWGNKVRSVLTVLGVIIGVTSVTTLVSLGQGLKNDVAQSIQGFGTNVITITGGKIDTSRVGQTTSNPANFITGDILTIDDVAAIEQLPSIEAVAPLSLIPGALKYQDKIATPILYGTYPNFLKAFGILQLDKGAMIQETEGNYIVLGQASAEDLFGEVNPIGKTVKLGERELEVIGTLKKSKTVGLLGTEIDSFSLIPFDLATQINKDQVKIMRIIVKANDSADTNGVKSSVHDALLANHHGEEDFTVLTQDDLLGLLNTFLNLSTTLVSAIAAISLIVGGIGIMNIMLVTVTERTREIGLRKAVGATKVAILVQFLVEAIMVTLVGAIIGLAISFIVGAIIAAKTELTPAITPSIILLSVGISVIIGIIFGLWPALRAANRDPIEALRYE